MRRSVPRFRRMILATTLMLMYFILDSALRANALPLRILLTLGSFDFRLVLGGLWAEISTLMWQPGSQPASERTTTGPSGKYATKGFFDTIIHPL